MGIDQVDFIFYCGIFGTVWCYVQARCTGVDVWPTEETNGKLLLAQAVGGTLGYLGFVYGASLIPIFD